MSVYRLRLFRVLSRKYTRQQLLFISTVHDSIEMDAVPEIVDDVIKACYEVALEMPQLIEQVFKFKYNLPFVVEVETLEDVYPVC